MEEDTPAWPAGWARPYVVHYALTPLMGFLSLVLLGLAGWMAWGLANAFRVEPPDPSGSDIQYYVLAVVVIGGGAVFCAVLGGFWLYTGLAHVVALRADEFGITLGRQVFPPRGAVAVPWDDVRAVYVLFARQVGYRAPERVVALRLTERATRPHGVPRRGRIRAWLYWFNVDDAPPADVYRLVHGWELDDGELRAAIRAYGRHVPLIDHTK